MPGKYISKPFVRSKSSMKTPFIDSLSILAHLMAMDSSDASFESAFNEASQRYHVVWLRLYFAYADSKRDVHTLPPMSLNWIVRSAWRDILVSDLINQFTRHCNQVSKEKRSLQNDIRKLESALRNVIVVAHAVLARISSQGELSGNGPQDQPQDSSPSQSDNYRPKNPAIEGDPLPPDVSQKPSSFEEYFPVHHQFPNDEDVGWIPTTILKPDHELEFVENEVREVAQHIETLNKAWRAISDASTRLRILKTGYVSNEQYSRTDKRLEEFREGYSKLYSKTALGLTDAKNALRVTLGYDSLPLDGESSDAAVLRNVLETVFSHFDHILSDACALEPINVAEGDRFDSQFMVIIRTKTAETQGMSNKVAKVLSDGYHLKDNPQQIYIKTRVEVYK